MTAPAVVLVTDPSWSVDRIEAVIAAAEDALPRGSFAVQLRDKLAGASALARTAARLRARATTLWINAPTPAVLRVARETGADGVHVPCDRSAIAEARSLLGADAWISTPAHDEDQVAIARDGGATGVLVSPIFASPGKGAPRGVAALTAARTNAPALVIIALGGVDASNVAACASAGAHGVAVIRALLDAPDPAAIARALHVPFGR
jgi:thiamine-phosphate pyrophosphorylase